MAPCEAFCRQKCRSLICWAEAGETQLFGLDIVQEMMEQVKLIQEMMVTVQSRQKSYANIIRRELAFEEDNSVYLKVSPMKCVKRFRLKGKLSPRYIRHYKVVERVGSIVYQVWLPMEYEGIHNMFHV